MKPTPERARSSVFVVIGIYKLVSAVLLAAAAVAVIRLFHKDVEAHVEYWLDVFNSAVVTHFSLHSDAIDPRNHYVGGVLHQLRKVHTRELKGLAAFGFLYAVLSLIEGTGLLLGLPWAKWLTVVATAALLPLELYEIVTGISVANVGLFVINAAI